MAGKERQGGQGRARQCRNKIPNSWLPGWRLHTHCKQTGSHPSFCLALWVHNCTCLLCLHQPSFNIHVSFLSDPQIRLVWVQIYICLMEIFVRGDMGFKAWTTLLVHTHPPPYLLGFLPSKIKSRNEKNGRPPVKTWCPFIFHSLTLVWGLVSSKLTTIHFSDEDFFTSSDF